MPLPDVTPCRIIETRYHGPTDTRGSRVSARLPSGEKLSAPWAYELGIEDNHTSAAVALCERLGWPAPTLAGNSVGGNRLYVVVVRP